MIEARFERWAGWCGPLYFVLVFLGLNLAVTPDIGAPVRQYGEWAADVSAGRTLAAGVVGLLAQLAAVVFVVGLAARARRAGAGGVATAAVVVAAGSFAAYVVGHGLVAALAERVQLDHPPTTTVALLLDLSTACFWVGSAATAVALALLCGALLARRAVPVWMSTIGLVLSVLSVASLPLLLTDTVHLPQSLLALWVAVAGGLLGAGRGGVRVQSASAPSQPEPLMWSPALSGCARKASRRRPGGAPSRGRQAIRSRRSEQRADGFAWQLMRAGRPPPPRQ